MFNRSLRILFFSLLPFSVHATNTCLQDETSLTKNTLTEQDWRYATDLHGSKALTKASLLSEGAIWVNFSRVPRVDAKNNSWVELIYDLPKGDLKGAETIQLTYQSSRDLVVKLSQKEYGGKGDKSYAHYQHILPKAKKWVSACINVADFNRPSWTPTNSKDLGIIKAHVSAVYLVPDLKDDEGGNAVIQVKSITLLPLK
ncbi:hypothetical protein [Pseudoalteromonas sp. Ld20]|uniref:hypothetical protein n=1 Tax=Pseudoalteromonas sp. Ld20 TaxID=649165 RepID=UPI003869F6EA